MPDIVRIKKTGKALYVTGVMPEKKGDKFEATDVLETRPQSRGCVIETRDGAVGFSCSRGSVSYGHAAAPVKTYSFDPAIHEVDGGGST